MPRGDWQDNISASFSSAELCLTVFLIWFPTHPNSCLFLLHHFIDLAVPYSDTGPACSLVRFVRSSGDLEIMALVFLQPLERPWKTCVCGYRFIS